MIKGLAKPIGIGVILGTIGCVLSLLVLAAVSSGFDIPPSAVIPLATIASAFGAWLSGFLSGKISGKNGWLLGALSSIVLFLLSTLAGIGIFKDVNSSFIITKFLIMFGCGVIGGIMAVNLGKPRRR